MDSPPYKRTIHTDTPEYLGEPSTKKAKVEDTCLFPMDLLLKHPDISMDMLEEVMGTHEYKYWFANSSEIRFGKRYKGKTVKEVAADKEGMDYLRWCLKQEWFQFYEDIYDEVSQLFNK